MAAPDPMPGAMFDAARRRAGLSPAELWWAYFALGGQATPMELAAILAGDVRPSHATHDRLSQALNERFSDLGQNNPVPYFDDWRPS